MVSHIIENILLNLEINILHGYRVKNLPVDPVILDGGAHCGYFSKYYKKRFPSAKVVAIEPNPLTFERLKNNTKDLKNITLINKAIAINPEVKISNNKFSWGNKVTSNEEDIDVSGIKLSELMTKYSFDLIKLDIEGSEYKVLKEAINLLEECPNYLIELHKIHKKRPTIKKLIYLLQEMSYVINFRWLGIPIPKNLIYWFPNGIVLLATKT